MPEKFCTEEDRIAHSTLYKAVHGLGKSILVQEEKVREGIKKLQIAFLTQNKAPLPGRPHTKALYEHTWEREAAVHRILLPLLYHCIIEPRFASIFYVYLRPLRLISSSLDPPVCKLYNK